MSESSEIAEASAAGSPNTETPDGVFLIHGLGGTQYDLGSMHKRLKNAGLVTHSLTLPGHGTTPESLIGVTAEDWIDAVVAKYREVRVLHPRLHIMGMCMGALLSAVLAQRERHSQGNLILLAPPVYIDGWATPWYSSVSRSSITSQPSQGGGGPTNVAGSPVGAAGGARRRPPVASCG